MNTSEWIAIPTKLQEAGFAVSYCRISFPWEDPRWRAKAQQGGKEWTVVESDLETALIELEKQTSKFERRWVDWEKAPTTRNSNTRSGTKVSKTQAA